MFAHKNCAFLLFSIPVFPMISFGYGPRSGVSRSEGRNMLKDWLSITKLFSKSIVSIYVPTIEILLKL